MSQCRGGLNPDFPDLDFSALTSFFFCSGLGKLAKLSLRPCTARAQRAYDREKLGGFATIGNILAYTDHTTRCHCNPVHHDAFAPQEGEQRMAQFSVHGGVCATCAPRATFTACFPTMAWASPPPKTAPTKRKPLGGKHDSLVRIGGQVFAPRTRDFSQNQESEQSKLAN